MYYVAFKDIFIDGMTLLVDFALKLIVFKLKWEFIFLIEKISGHSLAIVSK